MMTFSRELHAFELYIDDDVEQAQQRRVDNDDGNMQLETQKKVENQAANN